MARKCGRVGPLLGALFGRRRMRSEGVVTRSAGRHMRRLNALLVGWIGLVVAVAVPRQVAAEDFYVGKRLTIIVGLEAGGTVDTLARAFSVYLRKHIPGN